MNQHEITAHLFRTEYSKIVAVLCRIFNIKHLETAEDIASETFLKASEHWSIKGIPENPTAWLYAVAKNKAKDHFKHVAIFENKISHEIKSNERQTELQQTFGFDNKSISDSQLEMIFLVCNPINSQEVQICLALQILCAFSVEEIANAFLTKKETIKKRLQRARINLKNDHFQITTLHEPQIKLRLDTVLKTIYLLFNEGYFSKTNKQFIRKELCSEAIRLALVLTENTFTNTAQANALLALMCFQSSRLEARTDNKGEAVLFDEQDKKLWDRTLIEKGNYYLVAACENGNSEISKYHLEAAIAYWHTTPTDQNKYQHILQLYNQLILIEYSPMTALSSVFAFSKVYGNKMAIIETEKLNLTDNEYYHGLLGYLYTETDIHKAIGFYEQAIQLTKSKTQKQTLQKQVALLKKRPHSLNGSPDQST